MSERNPLTPTARYTGSGVRCDALATIIRREEALRGGPKRIQLSQYADDKGSFAATLAEEISASGTMTAGAAKRRLYDILSGKQELVTLDTADKILVGLDLVHLWHTELADAIVHYRPAPQTHPRTTAKVVRLPEPCAGCGGHRDESTPACRVCSSRHCQRKRYARLRRPVRFAATPAQSSSGPRRASVGRGSPSQKRVAA